MNRKKKRALLGGVFLAGVSRAAAGMAAPARAQTGPPPVPDEVAIRQAVLDYMEGGLTGDADRVARGVHGELNKVEIGVLPDGETPILLYNTASTLIANVRSHTPEALVEADKSVEVTVFDVGNNMAAARAVGALWYDLLHLAKIDGEWRIVNVLWVNRQIAAGKGTTDPGARGEVEAVVRDFIEGIYAGDTERLSRAMHPEIHKVLLQSMPETGESFLYRMGSSGMLAAVGAGLLNRPQEEWKLDLEVYDLSLGLASVKATSSQFIDQLLLGKVNGEWKILNDLWVVNPEAGPEGG